MSSLSVRSAASPISFGQRCTARRMIYLGSRSSAPLIFQPVYNFPRTEKWPRAYRQLDQRSNDPIDRRSESSSSSRPRVSRVTIEAIVDKAFRYKIQQPLASEEVYRSVPRDLSFFHELSGLIQPDRNLDPRGISAYTRRRHSRASHINLRWIAA